jgi:hypothetical protein
MIVIQDILRVMFVFLGAVIAGGRADRYLCMNGAIVGGDGIGRRLFERCYDGRAWKDVGVGYLGPFCYADGAGGVLFLDGTWMQR